MSRPIAVKRSRNYLRQVKGASVGKGIALALAFLAVPLMIRYLGKEQYGIWSTLLSLMSWVVFFDLGIGNGLRNEVAAALATRRREQAPVFVSSAYTLIGLLALSLYVILFIFTPFIPWQSIFNSHTVPEADLVLAVRIAGFFLLLNFWLGLVEAMIGAIQRTAVLTFGQIMANLLVLIFVYLLLRETSASIPLMAGAYGISIVIANLSLSVWFYRGYPDFLPRLRLRHEYLRPLLITGAKFFLIQMAVLVIFATDKILLTQLFGPSDVTDYDVVFKLFSVITVTHGLVIAPLWSAYTDAYHRGELKWIANMVRRQLLVFAGLAMAAFVLVLGSAPIIRFWIGPEFITSTPLILSMGAFVVIVAWNNVFAYVTNGIGKIKIQMYAAIFAMLINIPLSIFLVKVIGLGPYGIVIGTCLSLSLGAILIPSQVWILLKRSETQESIEPGRS